MLGKINGEDMCLNAGCSLIWNVELGIVSEVILQNLLELLARGVNDYIHVGIDCKIIR